MKKLWILAAILGVLTACSPEQAQLLDDVDTIVDAVT